MLLLSVRRIPSLTLSTLLSVIDKLEDPLFDDIPLFHILLPPVIVFPDTLTPEEPVISTPALNPSPLLIPKLLIILLVTSIDEDCLPDITTPDLPTVFNEFWYTLPSVTLLKIIPFPKDLAELFVLKILLSATSIPLTTDTSIALLGIFTNLLNSILMSFDIHYHQLHY